MTTHRHTNINTTDAMLIAAEVDGAFDIIVRTRMSNGAETEDYVARSRATGKTKP